MIEVQFQALYNLHTEINESAIMVFMNDALKKAVKGETWILFDEINTCNHLGSLADLISNRKFQDKPIHPNIRLFATCNPYRLHKSKSNLTNIDKRYDEIQINLVCQVNSKPNDEYKYIQIIVEKELKNKLTHSVFSELLFASQKFIRKAEKPYSVSLRDIKRAIKLVNFFYDSLENRPTYKSGHKYPPPGDPTTITRSYILSLGVCYHSRLYKQDLRKQYRCEMGQILQNHKIDINEKIFCKIIREEQEDYFNRMQCPPDIAKNEALLEHVLVTTVCILTRIPVFIIGETGYVINYEYVISSIIF